MAPPRPKEVTPEDQFLEAVRKISCQPDAPPSALEKIPRGFGGGCVEFKNACGRIETAIIGMANDGTRFRGREFIYATLPAFLARHPELRTTAVGKNYVHQLGLLGLAIAGMETETVTDGKSSYYTEVLGGHAKKPENLRLAEALRNAEVEIARLGPSSAACAPEAPASVAAKVAPSMLAAEGAAHDRPWAAGYLLRDDLTNAAASAHGGSASPSPSPNIHASPSATPSPTVAAAPKSMAQSGLVGWAQKVSAWPAFSFTPEREKNLADIIGATLYPHGKDPPSCKGVYHEELLGLMAKSFVSNMCSPENTLLYSSPGESFSTRRPLDKGFENQAIDIWGPKSVGIAQIDELKNFDDSRLRYLVGSYGLMYGLTNAESGGNPLIGSHMNVSSSSFAELEHGMFQASLSSLIGDFNETSESKRLTTMFIDYASTVTANADKSSAAHAKLDQKCLINDVFSHDRNQYNDYFATHSHDIERLGVTINGKRHPHYIPPSDLTVDVAHAKLEGAPMGACIATLTNFQKVLDDYQRTGKKGPNFKTLPWNNSTVDRCFGILQEYCPAFSMSYSAVALRTNLRHQGPLRTDIGDVIHQPDKQASIQCSGKVFAAIAQNYDKLCGHKFDLPPLEDQSKKKKGR